MAQQVPDVRVRLSAEGVDEVVRAFQQVSAAAKKSGKDASVGMNVLKDALEGIKSILPAISVGAAVVGLSVLVKGALDTADAIGKLSLKTGISTENLSALRLAATVTDTSFESLSKGLEKFDKTMAELDQGSTTAGAAVRRLFGSTQALNGLNTDQRLEKVIGAIAKMGDGYLKTKAAQDFFGKSGAELIPLIDSLGDGGFEKLRQKAEEFGLALDDKTTAAATRAKEAMKLLQLEVQGAATQFVSGLAPAAEKALGALEEATTGDATNGFRQLGEYVGTVAKGIIYAFELVGKSVGTSIAIVLEILRGGLDVIENKFSEIKTSFLGVGAALKQAVTGDFAGAKATYLATNAALAAADKRDEQQAKDHLQRIKELFSQLVTDPQTDFNKLFNTPEKASEPKKTGGSGGDQDAAAAKARLALLQARLDNELALFKAHEAQLEQQNEEAYKQGRESIAAYFDQRRSIIEAESDKEIATLQAKRALVAQTPTDNQAEAIKQREDLEKLDAQIAEARVKRSTDLAAVEAERNAAQFALKQKELDIEKQIQTAQGNTYTAALAAIQKQAQELLRQGIDPAIVQKLTDVLTDEETFKDTQRQANLAQGQLSLDQGQLTNQVDAGKLFPSQAAELYRQKLIALLPTLQDYATALTKSAVSPEEVQAAAQYQQKIDALGISVDQAAQQMAALKHGIEQGVQSSLEQFLDSGIDKAKSFGDAMRTAALSVVDSLRKIVSQMLATIATQKLLSAVGGLIGGSGSDTGQQVSVAAATGVAQATPLVAAGSVLTAAGSSLTVAGGTLGGAAGGMLTGATAVGIAASQLQAAADTMLVANGGGSLFGFAEGGLVAAPGTGTSDSGIARVSRGEFIVRQAAVSQPGVLPLLASINRGMGSPVLRGRDLPRFASGGLVTAHDIMQRSSGGRSEVYLGIEEGVFVKRVTGILKGRSGQEITIQNMAKNQKRASRALGG
jgi:hypothetical protein